MAGSSPKIDGMSNIGKQFEEIMKNNKDLAAISPTSEENARVREIGQNRKLRGIRREITNPITFEASHRALHEHSDREFDRRNLVGKEKELDDLEKELLSGVDKTPDDVIWKQHADRLDNPVIVNKETGVHSCDICGKVFPHLSSEK